MTYLNLSYREDRLGSQLHNYIFQIIYAIHFKYYIKYSNNLPYIDNIFMKSILEFVDEYNKSLNEDFSNSCDTLINNDLYIVSINTIINIKSDSYSYFRKNILPSIKEKILINSQINNYIIPFNSFRTETFSKYY